MKISMNRIAGAIGLVAIMVLPAPLTGAQVPDIRDFLLNTSRAVYVEVSIRADGTAQLLDLGITEVPA
ncbi:MAG: hypothetical protein V2I26_08100, partial [Halieaceae bacterium]|nr:hypothetical protein [Halieaceae bacterium]